jgi:hypothetical protein
MAHEEHDAGQRRRIRRSALIWGGLAAAIYFGYIIAALVRGWHR